MAMTNAVNSLAIHNSRFITIPPLNLEPSGRPPTRKRCVSSNRNAIPNGRPRPSPFSNYCPLKQSPLPFPSIMQMPSKRFPSTAK